MKKILKNTILQKTIISILVITLCINFMFPTIVRADFGDAIGGVLYRPIQAFVLFLGDAIMGVVSTCSGSDTYPILTLNQNGLPLLGGIKDYYDNDTSLLEKAALFFINATFYPITGAVSTINWIINIDEFPDELEIPMFVVTPELIFSNDVPLVDVNIFEPKEGSTAYDLQSVISKWYNAFRNLAIVGLLSVLVYVAIRIIISSTSTDKAKYKQLFFDWLIAFCLLFFIHYIMSFSIIMVESLNDTLKHANNKYYTLPITINQITKEYGYENYDKLGVLQDENGYIRTNLMGYVRFMAQTNTLRDSNGNDITAIGGKSQLTYTIIYCLLVIYTVMFLFIYIKRFIYICFLTIISPLVALTYPIDKIKDGKAQGFNTWLKEYIFNLLIQPIHLVLYMLFIGSALELSVKYLIYPLVVLGFMLQAEKIIRKLFGFESSSTASSLTNSALGGALVMQGLNMLKSGGKKVVKGAANIADKDSKITMADDRKKDAGIDDNAFIAKALGREKGNTETQKDSNTIDTQNGNNWTEDDKKRYDDLNNYLNNNPEINQEYFNNKKEFDELNEKMRKAEEAEMLKQAAEEEEMLKKEAEEEAALRKSEEEAAKIANEKPNYFKGARTLVGNYLSNPNTIKNALGFAGKVAGAATFGTIGVAAGLASDDYSNVLKYGIGAGAAGASIGGNLGNKTIELPSNAYKKYDKFRDALNKESYSKEAYEKMKNEQLDNQFMKNKEIQKLYQSKFKKDYEKAMKAALEYRKHGITDNDIIIKAMKAKSQNIDASDFANKKRIVSAKLAKQINNEKDIQTMKERLEENGINKQQIEDQASMLRQIKDLY